MFDKLKRNADHESDEFGSLGFNLLYYSTGSEYTTYCYSRSALCHLEFSGVFCQYSQRENLKVIF